MIFRDSSFGLNLSGQNPKLEFYFIFCFKIKALSLQ